MKLLVVVDMQNDFIDMALGTKEAPLIVPYVKKKIEKYREEGNPVVFTRDTHHENYLETQEGRNLPVVHCIKDTLGWQISSQLDVADSLVFDKPTFGSVELSSYVSSLENLKEVELVGLCTGICVISNALLIKASLPELLVTVDSSCCACVTPQSHATALDAMRLCQINVI